MIPATLPEQGVGGLVTRSMDADGPPPAELSFTLRGHWNTASLAARLLAGIALGALAFRLVRPRAAGIAALVAFTVAGAAWARRDHALVTETWLRADAEALEASRPGEAAIEVAWADVEGALGRKGDGATLDLASILQGRTVPAGGSMHCEGGVLWLSWHDAELSLAGVPEWTTLVLERRDGGRAVVVPLGWMTATARLSLYRYVDARVRG
jgi:hypothetical protein